MRHVLISLCIFTAACSGQTFSPTSPSGVAGVAGAQTQANGGANVEVTFTKWVPAFPTLAGVTGGDVPGTFAGEVLSRDPFDNGNIVQLEARYEVIGQDATHSFVAHIEGKQNNETQEAVFNGTIIEGWLLGAQVHVTYDRIAPCPAFGKAVCFTGVIRVMPGSAN
jgi:FtsP/CotA-like multicopper oxidase with cupredoxin domain